MKNVKDYSDKLANKGSYALQASMHLIKNFINSVIYDFNDPLSRIALLQKLNNKYTVLIREKVYEEFN